MNRRQFIEAAGTLGGAILTHPASLAAPPAIPVIDTHIHLFDPTRPGGVLWPEKGDLIYRPALPPRYQSLIAGLNVVGAIAIEASPLRSDNQWLLDTAKSSPLIVGVIGNLDPAAADFADSLDRLHQEPLFHGFRYGNLWNRDLQADLLKPHFLDGLKLLAQADLVFESANPNPRLIRALAQVSERVPRLRIVIDHLPNATPPADGPERDTYRKELQELGTSPNVYVKLSEIGVGKPQSSAESTQQRATLDELWDIFGEDKLMYGSDWPNSDHDRPYRAIYDLFQHYIRDKSPLAQEKVCWRNSHKAYAWKPRSPRQP